VPAFVSTTEAGLKLESANIPTASNTMKTKFFLRTACLFVINFIGRLLYYI